jgi:transcriptional regulator with XRE-family HTH domain
MTEEEIRRALRKALEHKTQQSYARELGISISYLSQVLRGRRPPGPAILNALGLERGRTYRAAR